MSEHWLSHLQAGTADAYNQQRAAKEIEWLRAALAEHCPGDCPGRLKFHAAKENGE